LTLNPILDIIAILKQQGEKMNYLDNKYREFDQMDLYIARDSIAEKMNSLADAISLMQEIYDDQEILYDYLDEKIEC
jgi:hypothetical protein